MSVIEGMKDFLAGLLAVILAAILIILLVLLWPFITVIGWVAIMLILVAISIIIAFGLVMIIGKAVRGSYKK